MNFYKGTSVMQSNLSFSVSLSHSDYEPKSNVRHHSHALRRRRRLLLIELIISSCSCNASGFNSSASSSSRFTLISRLAATTTFSFSSAAASPSSSSSVLTPPMSATSAFITSLPANARKSAVNSTECAQPASLPHKLRNRSPIASYVARVRLACLPLPNL